MNEQIITTENKSGRPYSTWLSRFDSPAEFVAAARAAVTSKRDDRGWTGETWEEGASRAIAGNDRLVPDAEALIDKINAAGIDTPRSEFVPSVAGAFPIVPEYLAGHPAHMRRKVPASSDRAPMTIYVDLTSSGGIEHRDMNKRGTAALALAMLLSAERPTSLYAIVGLSRHRENEGEGNGAALAAIKINSQPLELATACHVLTSQAFARSVGYQYLYAAGRSGGGWPWELHPFDGNRPKFIARMKDVLGLDGTALYVPPPHLNEEKSFRDPIGWINDRLAEVRQQEQPAP
jgi:hypothetical protein